MAEQRDAAHALHRRARRDEGHRPDRAGVPGRRRHGRAEVALNAQRRRVLILGGGISGIALASQLDEDVEIRGAARADRRPLRHDHRERLHLRRRRPAHHVQQEQGGAEPDGRRARRERPSAPPREQDLVQGADGEVSVRERSGVAAAGGQLRVHLRLHRQSARGRHAGEPRQWSYKTFGAGISEKYFIPYNEKIWNYDAAEDRARVRRRASRSRRWRTCSSRRSGFRPRGICISCTSTIRSRAGTSRIVHAFAKRVRGDDPHRLARGVASSATASTGA